MRALIMAGGSGTRLGRGEKPLTNICGMPMLSYITGSFSSAGYEPVVAVSRKTPMTANWCRAHGICVVRTTGDGYIEDMINAIHILEEDEPVFISVSDVPCITGLIISEIRRSYDNCGKDALSVWVPKRLTKSCRSMPYVEQVGGIDACPAGVNILRGACVDKIQEEFALLLDEPRLALNVNTPEDLARTEEFLMAGTAGQILNNPS